MRVHQLAKDLGVTSKEVLARLREYEIQVKNHMAELTDEQTELVRSEWGKPITKPAPKPTPPPAKKEAPVKEQKKARKPSKAAVEAEPKPPAEQKEAVPAEPKAKAEPEAGTEPEKPAEATQAAPAAEAAAPAPKAKKPKASRAAKRDKTAIQVEDGTVKIRGAVVVKDLAVQLELPPNRIISELMKLNILASINERVDAKIARKIAEKHGFTVEEERRDAGRKPALKRGSEEEPEEDRPEDLQPRAPVITFLGHVDHGKTSLLDKIRDTSVTEGEHGGITQHIGAYTVDVSGQRITFLDTPGHEAFTAMRARGANLTDIAVIIIAADDGIMPQTREAIQHARAAGVSLMVAINKIDLPGANVDRVKQQLQAEDLSPEDWGGETICVPVSAQTGEGIDHLLEMILLQAEVLELTANPRRKARGFVIEAQLQPGMGPTANLLVTAGTLKLGDTVLCGQHWGRVRALINDHGVKIKSAGPSTPVKCLGLSGVPEAGMEFQVFANEKAARSQAQQAEEDQKAQQLSAPRKATLDGLFEQLEQEEKLTLQVILKADTQGSVEAISESLYDIKSDKVSLDIILGGTGNITVNDVMLASASDAVVIGFHVAKEPGVDSAAKHEGVDIRLHHVIYELLDEIREAMTGLLKPELRERVIGQAEIRQIFSVGKNATVAGCLVAKGRVRAKARARVRRGDEVLFEGGVASMRHFQDEVAEVREGQECGIRLEGFKEFEEGDTLEFYEMEEVERTL